VSLPFFLLTLMLSEKEIPTPQKDGSWTGVPCHNHRRYHRDNNLLYDDVDAAFVVDFAVDVDRDDHVAVGDVLDATKELPCWYSTTVSIVVNGVDEQENVLVVGVFPTFF